MIMDAVEQGVIEQAHPVASRLVGTAQPSITVPTHEPAGPSAPAPEPPPTASPPTVLLPKGHLSPNHIRKAGTVYAETLTRLETAGLTLGTGDRTALAHLTSGDPDTLATVMSLLSQALHTGIITGQLRPMNTGRSLWALHIPADPEQHIQVIQIPNSAAAISDTIGGGLLDDTTTGQLPNGTHYTIYLNQNPNDLPDNPRAATLTARLGHTDRDVQTRIRGDTLITGLDPQTGDDTNVPAELLHALRHCGLTVH